MGRWATTAVDKAIEREIHDAHAAGRAPSLTYKPFTVLRTEDRYRTNQQLEREYLAKGVRNPFSFTDTVGPYVDAAWRYRRANALAAERPARPWLAGRAGLISASSKHGQGGGI